jgi:hypothetical protein
MSEAPPIASDAAMLQEFLRDRDVACPKCEYNLRNLVGSRCPECGDALVLRVNLVEPKLAAFLTGLAGLAAGAGFYVMLLIFAIVKERAPSNIMRILFGGSFVMSVCLATWVLQRHAIRRQPAGTQWVISIACWAIAVVGLIVFISNVR